MFDFLKKKLRDSAKKLADKVSKEPKEGVKEKPKEKKAFLKKIKKRVTERELSEKDIEEFFQDLETDLLQANVALEVSEALKTGLKERLVGKPIKRTKASEFIKKAFEASLFEIVSQEGTDLVKLVKSKRPACLLFLGFNGSGKTTTIAKVAKYLMDRGLKPVLAAGDTFRAASIEQLEHHGNKLGIKTIKHTYGADSAAVVFDARKYAEAKRCDVVLADTAGRSHADKNLMDELRKVVRVNRPELKILVVDSLTGNDVVEQARTFHQAVGVDGVILTKIDVNKKGGSVLSVCWAIKKPILFFGTGQGYGDLRLFKPDKFVEELV